MCGNKNDTTNDECSSSNEHSLHGKLCQMIVQTLRICFTRPYEYLGITVLTMGCIYMTNQVEYRKLDIYEYDNAISFLMNIELINFVRSCILALHDVMAVYVCMDYYRGRNATISGVQEASQQEQINDTKSTAISPTTVVLTWANVLALKIYSSCDQSVGKELFHLCFDDPPESFVIISWLGNEEVEKYIFLLKDFLDTSSGLIFLRNLFPPFVYWFLVIRPVVFLPTEIPMLAISEQKEDVEDSNKRFKRHYYYLTYTLTLIYLVKGLMRKLLTNKEAIGIANLILNQLEMIFGFVLCQEVDLLPNGRKKKCHDKVDGGGKS